MHRLKFVILVHEIFYSIKLAPFNHFLKNATLKAMLISGTKNYKTLKHLAANGFKFFSLPIFLYQLYLNSC